MSQPVEERMKRVALVVAAERWREPEGSLLATEVPKALFQTWRFWRVENDSMPPLVLFVATDGKGWEVVEWASGMRAPFVAEPGKPMSGPEALEIAQFFSSMASPSQHLLSSAQDIPGTTEEELAVWRERIQPPKVRQDGVAFVVDAWAWERGDLRQVTFTLQQSVGLTAHTSERLATIGMAVSLE